MRAGSALMVSERLTSKLPMASTLDQKSDGSGPDDHDVRQVADQLLPGLPGVGGTPDPAVAGAEVDAGLGVLVGAHRVAHHRDVEGVGESLAELLSGVTGIAGPPDPGPGVGRVAAVAAVD